MLKIEPIGVVRSSISAPSLVAKKEGIELQESLEEVVARHRAQREKVSEIVIEPCWQELLDGIEGFSHLVVLFWAHLLPEERRSLHKVHPMGVRDNPLTGIFATRSPARPNPVLMTVVRLLSRQGNVLRVTGLDAVDNSPVVDIKPYVPEAIPPEEVQVPAWMARIQRQHRQNEAG